MRCLLIGSNLFVLKMERTFRFARQVVSAYILDDCRMMAAAIAYYVLLALVPALLLAIGALGIVMGNSLESLHAIRMFLTRNLPVGPHFISYMVREIVSDRRILGGVGLVGVLFLASQVMVNLEIAFNRIWGIDHNRSYLWRRLYGLGVTILVLLMLILSLLLSGFYTYIRHFKIPGLSISPDRVPILWSLIGTLTPLVLSVLMFSILYKLVPHRRTSWKATLSGGLFAGLCWEVAKYLFTFYLVHFDSYAKLYGSLGSLFILLFWVYYSSTILLIGAEIGAICDHQKVCPVEVMETIQLASPGHKDGGTGDKDFSGRGV
ncbi:MAG: YihY/virulence factor BrkB family protein [Armatimonadetes bacterium]|nr:YihY/virulence factor BrkB family protein [Armatimonadota bacterium]